MTEKSAFTFSDNERDYVVTYSLKVFGITRALSQAGCPYDNAAAESTYRAFKIEFIQQGSFHSLEELTLKTKDDVHWWNHHCIHGSLNYQTPLTTFYF